MSAPSLRSNFVWVLGGSLVLAVTQFAMLIALTKLAPTQAMGAMRVGQWTLAAAITGPVFVFFLFKLRALQATDARNEHGWPAYASVRVLGMISALIITLIVVALGYRNHTALIILGVALMKCFEGGSELVYGHLQHADLLDQVARSQIGRGLSALVVAITLLVVTDSLAVSTFGTAGVYAAWMTRDLVGARRRCGITAPSRDLTAIGKLLRQCAPLGMVGAIGSLQANVPRYFLEYNGSLSELGVFGAMQTLLILGGLVINAIAHAALARMSRHAAAGEWHAFARTLRTLVLLGSGLGVVAVVLAATLGEPVLRLIYNDEFARHHDVLIWLAATSGLLWMYMFFGTALDAMRRYGIQPWIHGTSTAIIAIASWQLVPRYHLLGASWAMLIGFAAECTMYIVAVALPLRAEIRGQVRRPVG